MTRVHALSGRLQRVSFDRLWFEVLWLIPVTFNDVFDKERSDLDYPFCKHDHGRDITRLAANYNLL